MISAHALTFFVALVLAAFFTPVVRGFALRFQILDQPHPRKIHLTPKPLLGGLAIYLAVVLGLLLVVDEQSWGQAMALTAGATLMVAVGLLDDFFSLNARLKLVLAIPLAGLILAVGGVRVTAFPFSPFVSHSPNTALVLSHNVPAERGAWRL